MAQDLPQGDEHRKTYSLFIRMVKWGIPASIILFLILFLLTT